MAPFQINFLDHVALYVADMERSISWYQEVLGLQKYQLEHWGAFPIFMLAGKSGVALFPAHLKGTKHSLPDIRIDHFAFNVSNEAFEQAQEHFQKLEIPYEFQDHHYFHSVYLTDLDGHTVELTTIQVAEETFYKASK